MGIKSSTSSFWYLDVMLSSVILHFIYFASMTAGYSITGLYSVEVMHSFKFIRNIFT